MICEANSQVLVNMLLERKTSNISWQLSLIVKHILQVSSLMDSIHYAHIPREWNRVADCLAKWASEAIDGRKIEEREQMPYELCQDFEMILADDNSGTRE